MVGIAAVDNLLAAVEGNPGEGLGCSLVGDRGFALESRSNLVRT